MKKTIKRCGAALCALLLIACVAVFGGCKEKAEVYKIEKLIFEMESGKIEVSVGETYNGFTLTKDYFTIILKKDGTSALSGAYASGEGTWEQEGDQITITIEGEPQTFTLQNGKLVMEEGAVELGLKYTAVLSK